VEIDRGVLWIWDRRGHLLAKVNCGHNRLYMLHMEVARPLCLTTCRDDEVWRWHERFRHLHFEAFQKLGCEQMVRWMPQIDHVEQLCNTYMVTKLKRRPFPRLAVYRMQKQLELIHDDPCGPITPATLGGQHYLLLLVDDASWFMWAILLATKAVAADTIKHVQAAAEKESGLKLQVMCTDNSGEFAAYCVNEGIQRHYSAPYSPQQNGTVKRGNQTVVATARALLKQRGMPTKF
jgi:hypothetical protein